MSFQTPRTVNPHRGDHVWQWRGQDYKCVLCGGVCRSPPSYPTPAGWLPDHYERLTVEDLQLDQAPQAVLANRTPERGGGQAGSAGSTPGTATDQDVRNYRRKRRRPGEY